MLQNKSKDSRTKKEEDGAPRQPDPETLGTSDPQEHMKGPVSSAVQKVRKEAEENDAEEGKKDQED
jgi:hypothetical protein